MMRWLGMLLLVATVSGQTPEERAISYLEGEVQAWSRDNGCYSCHNDGDGARALYAAMGAGYRVQGEALASTARWLGNPAGWDDNKGDPGFSDKGLARLQWTVTLAAAGERADGLAAAAQLIADDQTEDGSWPGGADGSIGSPVTWGRALATAMAVRALRQAGASEFADRITRAEAWLARLEPKNTPDAAAVVFAFGNREPAAKAHRFLESAQASDGGWGPYRNAPSEVFDTALAVLSLEDPSLRRSGREYILRTQLPGGGWMETTRPSGSQSYAQHVSTTAWALLALLATDGERD